MKLKATNYIPKLTTVGGGDLRFCRVNPEKHCVILFHVRFNFKISTAFLVVEYSLTSFPRHLVVFFHVAA